MSTIRNTPAPVAAQSVQGTRPPKISGRRWLRRGSTHPKLVTWTPISLKATQR